MSLAGCRFGVCAPAMCCLPSPSRTHAAVTTPAKTTGARVTRFPVVDSLPRISDGSAFASPFSRPAQRSLALRPACSLTALRRPLTSKCFSPCRYLHEPLRLLPAGATVAGRDLNPLGDGAFSRRTERTELTVLLTVWFRQRLGLRQGFSRKQLVTVGRMVNEQGNNHRCLN